MPLPCRVADMSLSIIAFSRLCGCRFFCLARSILGRLHRGRLNQSERPKSWRMRGNFPLSFLAIFLLCAWLPSAGDALAANCWGNAQSSDDTAAQKVLADHCLKCHGAEKKSSQLDLRDVAAMLAGGRKGPAAVPGDAAASRLIQVVLPGGKPHMPPGKKQLSEAEIETLSAWINALDATESAGNSNDSTSDSQSPAVESAAAETAGAAPAGVDGNAMSDVPSPENVTDENREDSTRDVAEVSGLPSVQLPPGLDPVTVIDFLIQAGYQRTDNSPLVPNGLCDDATFVRRVYLDLIARIPTLDETQAFLSDADSQKRNKLIDQLLQHPEYPRRMAQAFDTMLMGRNEGKLGQRQEHAWLAFLEKSFADNQPWDEFAAQVLLARVEDPAQDRGHLWYLYERKDNHQEIAEAVSKGFFGVDIACAQCHDHLIATEIKQAHYWGMVNFFKRTYNEKTDHGIALAESAIGGFDEYANALMGTTDKPVLTFLHSTTVPENRPDDPAKQEDDPNFYNQVPGEPKVPLFSRREKFVNEILHDHPLLARAMVNRIWGMMVGRGLVHPIEKMESAHPASHPELLDWLAQDFAAHGYDVQRLIRAIMNSRVYQLDSRRPANAQPDSFAYAISKPLTAEAFARSLQVSLQVPAEKIEPLNPELRRLFPDIVPENELTGLPQSLSLSNFPALNQLIWESANHQLATDDAGVAEPGVAEPGVAEAGVAEAGGPSAMALPPLPPQVDALFWRTFGRPPEAEESAAIDAYLQQRSDRPADAWAQVVWALITSAEFRFNH